jgi:hypothetical protein
VRHSVVTVTFTSFSATRLGAGEGLILTEPPVLITEKPGPGVAVGNGVGDGSGEVWGTAAGETVIISQEMVGELSDEVAVPSTVATVAGFVMLAHVKFLI